MTFEVIPTKLEDDRMKIISVMNESVCIGIIRASVDTEKYNNICIVYFSNMEVLRTFAKTQKPPVFVSSSRENAILQQEEWLIQASADEVDNTIWWDKSVDVYKIVEP